MAFGHIVKGSALVVAAALASLALAPGARAGVVTETYAFTLGGFVNGAGSDASPLSSITGDVTVTFDPAVFTVDDTADITVHSWTGPGGSPPGFTTLQFPLHNEIWIGDTLNGALFVVPGTDDFIVGLFTDDPAHPQFVPCADANCEGAPPTALAAGYTLADHPGDLWIATTGSVAAVPEPKAWSLMILGLGAVGGLLRTRRGRLAAV